MQTALSECHGFVPWQRRHGVVLQPLVVSGRRIAQHAALMAIRLHVSAGRFALTALCVCHSDCRLVGPFCSVGIAQECPGMAVPPDGSPPGDEEKLVSVDCCPAVERKLRTGRSRPASEYLECSMQVSPTPRPALREGRVSSTEVPAPSEPLRRPGMPQMGN